MKKYFVVIAVFLTLTASSIFAQAENVNLSDDVYKFLKEMKVKGIIGSIHDDVPNMSFSEVKSFLQKIDENRDKLSLTEQENLDKYKQKYYLENYTDENTSMMLGGNTSLSEGIGDLFSQKNKYLYYSIDDKFTFFSELTGHANIAQSIRDSKSSAQLMDLGFRFHGTILDNIGYSFSFSKGGVFGSRDLAAIVDPRLNQNFKFIENIENVSNYDFVEGYLRYEVNPTDKMHIDLEIGREKIILGYGYSESLSISGLAPNMDFFRVDFRYGIFNFSSIHASTVGNYSIARDSNYTKYVASNKLGVSIPKLFDFNIGESMIYSGRGLDWTYVNPLLFYKFAEMSIQDRDNGTLFLNLQTSCFKNFEFQGTFFLDEDILSNLQDLQLSTNKTAYQIGFQWYEPFQISDLSLTCEYTKIRPYVYSHVNPKNTFTSFGVILGNPIGPNSDEIMLRLAYNISSKARATLEYRYQRSGKNIVASDGTLIKNVGGSFLVPYLFGVDDLHTAFLDGIRYNYDYLTAVFRYEPWRDIFFDFAYYFMQEHNVTADATQITNYCNLKMTISF